MGSWFNSQTLSTTHQTLTSKIYTPSIKPLGPTPQAPNGTKLTNPIPVLQSRSATTTRLTFAALCRRPPCGEHECPSSSQQQRRQAQRRGITRHEGMSHCVEAEKGQDVVNAIVRCGSIRVLRKHHQKSSRDRGARCARGASVAVAVVEDRGARCASVVLVVGELLHRRSLLHGLHGFHRLSGRRRSSCRNYTSLNIYFASREAGEAESA